MQIFSMLRSLALLALLRTSEAGVVSLQRRSLQDLVVSTSSGELQGTVEDSAPNVRQFLGIPYAQSPVGDLRFQPPAPYAADGDARDASAYGPSCLQPGSSSLTALYDKYMPEFLPGSSAQSEDCLFLNVYAPAGAAEEKLPVFVFIPGGAFATGGANVPYAIPDQWVERTQEMVIVTINYRLNIFGFPNARGQSVNVGLLDQRLAVEWTRDNIAAFGGDPDNIILWGQSAGGYSTTNYGYAYPEDPIVKGIIAQSGGSGAYITALDVLHLSFTAAAVANGCASLSSAKELACMQKVDAGKLLDFVVNTPIAVFAAGVDGTTVFSDNKKRAAEGRIAKIPSLIGTNAREGTAFATTWTEESVSEIEVGITTNVIRCLPLGEIKNRLGGGLPTYHYLYSGNFSNITPLPWIGAMHTAELPLLSGQHSQYRGNSSELEWETSIAMQELWLSFAKDGTKDLSSTSSGFTWPLYDPEADTVAVFAADDKAVQLKSNSEVGPICL